MEVPITPPPTTMTRKVFAPPQSPATEADLSVNASPLLSGADAIGAWLRPAAPFSNERRRTFSAVIGASVMRTPVAAATALAMVASDSMRGGSPTALAPSTPASLAHSAR
jgi:hypothetical protein